LSLDEEVQQVSTMDTEESADELLVVVPPTTTTSTTTTSTMTTVVLSSITDDADISEQMRLEAENEQHTLMGGLEVGQEEAPTVELPTELLQKVVPPQQEEIEVLASKDKEIASPPVGEATVEIYPEDSNEPVEIHTMDDIVMPTDHDEKNEDATSSMLTMDVNVVPAVPPPPSSEERTDTVDLDEGEGVSRTVSFSSPTHDSSWNDELDPFSPPPPRSLSLSANARATSMDSATSAMIPDETFENEFDIPSFEQQRLERSMSKDSSAIPEELFENEFDAENDNNNNVDCQRMASRASSMLMPEEQFENEYDPAEKDSGDDDDDDEKEEDDPPTDPFLPPHLPAAIMVVGALVAVGMIIAATSLLWMSSSSGYERRRRRNYYDI